MSRKNDLLKAVDNNEILIPLIDEILHLEEELLYLRGLPQIVVHPKDRTRQKATPAAKLYKENLQQYSNLMKILLKATGIDEVDEESPLRKWLNDNRG